MLRHLNVGFAALLLMNLIDTEEACGDCARTFHPQEFMCDYKYFVLKVTAGTKFTESGTERYTVTIIEDYKDPQNNGHDIVIDTGNGPGGDCEVILTEGECYVLTGDIDGYSIAGPCNFRKGCSALTTTQVSGFGGEYLIGCECSISSSKTGIDLVKTQHNCLLQPYTSTTNCLVENAICKKPNRRCLRHHPCNWVIDGEDQCQ